MTPIQNGPDALQGDSGELGDELTFTMPALVGMQVNDVLASAKVGAVRYTNMVGETVTSADGRLVCQQSPDAGTTTHDGAVVLAISNTC